MARNKSDQSKKQGSRQQEQEGSGSPKKINTKATQQELKSESPENEAWEEFKKLVIDHLKQINEKQCSYLHYQCLCQIMLEEYYQDEKKD